MSRLQKAIMDVLSTGMYSYMDLPLNARSIGWKYHFYDSHSGNYRELKEQVSKLLGDGSDRNSLGMLLHDPTRKFTVSFSRAVRALERKGLVDVYTYGQIPVHQPRQHKKCPGREPIDEPGDLEPCQGCPVTEKERNHIFFVQGDTCYFINISNNKLRGRGEIKRRIFSVFLSEKYEDELKKKKKLIEIAEQDAGPTMADLQGY